MNKKNIFLMIKDNYTGFILPQLNKKEDYISYLTIIEYLDQDEIELNLNELSSDNIVFLFLKFNLLHNKKFWKIRIGKPCETLFPYIYKPLHAKVSLTDGNIEYIISQADFIMHFEEKSVINYDFIGNVLSCKWITCLWLCDDDYCEIESLCKVLNNVKQNTHIDTIHFQLFFKNDLGLLFSQFKILSNAINIVLDNNINIRYLHFTFSDNITDYENDIMNMVNDKHLYYLSVEGKIGKFSPENIYLDFNRKRLIKLSSVLFRFKKLKYMPNPAKVILIKYLFQYSVSKKYEDKFQKIPNIEFMKMKLDNYEFFKLA